MALARGIAVDKCALFLVPEKLVCRAVEALRFLLVDARILAHESGAFCHGAIGMNKQHLLRRLRTVGIKCCPVYKSPVAALAAHYAALIASCLDESHHGFHLRVDEADEIHIACMEIVVVDRAYPIEAVIEYGICVLCRRLVSAKPYNRALDAVVIEE